MSKRSLPALTGAAFLIVSIVAFAIGGEPPDVKRPVSEIGAFYVDNQTSVTIGAILAGLAGALLIFFGAHLRKVFSAAEGPSGVLSAAVLAGTAVMAVGIAIDATISFALAEAAQDIEPTAVQALQALWDNDFLPIAMGNLVFLVASGISILRHGALPKWLGWIAILLAVIGLTPLGFVAFIGGGIWIAVVSVLLALRARPVSEDSPHRDT